MTFSAAELEALGKIEEFSSNASAEAAQRHLDQQQYWPAIAKVRDSINSFLAKVYFQVNLHSRTSQDHERVTTEGGRNYKEITKLLKKEASAYPVTGVHANDHRDTIRPCSSKTVQTLYDIFNGDIALPCHGKHSEERFTFTQECTVALGLAGTKSSPGNQTHRYFETAIAVGQQYRWTRLQIQVSTSDEAKQHNIKEESQGIHADILHDFCELTTADISTFATPIRLDGNRSPYQWFRNNPFVVRDFPVEQDPITVSRALTEKLLSAESKIHLAFAISNSFWQFYNSDWMHLRWDLDDTILLLPQRTEHCDLNAEATVPYLAIRSGPVERFEEHEISSPGTGKRMHQHPFILSLCLLLVLIGTRTGRMPDGKKRSESVHEYCIRQVYNDHSDWPHFPASFKDEYKKIVSICLPEIACCEIRHSPEDRRRLLEDHIVRPLHNLLVRLQALKEPSLKMSQFCLEEPIVQDKNMTFTEDDVCKTSQDWLEKLTDSYLMYFVDKMSTISPKTPRPKIALIDTGYDPKLLENNRRRKRLKDSHWMDFCSGNSQPVDEDGHGTSMLDLLMRVAPFADICVARIARYNHDLDGKNVGASQERLAKAIEWATEIQQADVISMSLGWEHEHTMGKRWVSNAISKGLTQRDQKVLFFAAASNFGGGNRELFPARHSNVFSIRATDHHGMHQRFNPSLPEDPGASVFGTLGVGVPTMRMGGSLDPIARTGTSPATAIAAGIAAIVIAYINSSGHSDTWEELRTPTGYQRLLHNLSTEPEARKRFITLQEVFHDPSALRRLLDRAS